MLVDVHAHWYPPEALSALARGSRATRIVASGGRTLILRRESVVTTLEPGADDLDARLSEMDRNGIDIGVLSFGALDVAWTGAGSSRLCRAINAEYARLCRTAGGRFRFLASLPLNDPAGLEDELQRALDEGAVGVAVTTTVGGLDLDHPDLTPFWEAAQARGLAVLVHPCFPAGGPAGDKGAFLLAGFIGETTLAATRIVLAGLVDRYPDVKLIWSHLGGALPLLVRRLEAGAQRQVPGGPSAFASLRRCWFDTICTHGPALDCARETFGADRLLFGTDEPHRLEDPADVLAALAGRGWPQADLAAILGGNAGRVLPL